MHSRPVAEHGSRLPNAGNTSSRRSPAAFVPPAAPGALRDQQRLLLLAEFTGLLIGSLDYESSAAQATALLIPGFADACILELNASPAAPPLLIVQADPPCRPRVEQLLAACRSRATFVDPRTAGHSEIALPLVARGRALGTA